MDRIDDIKAAVIRIICRPRSTEMPIGARDMRYTGLCFLTKYDSENKVCTAAVLHEDKIIEVAEVKEEFTDEEREAILGVLKQTGKGQQKQIYKVPPGI